MRRASTLLLVFLLGACGQDEDPAPVKGPPPGPRTFTCPVEGTTFQEGQGVVVPGPNGTVVHVCSPGCRVRYELDREEGK